MPAIKQSVKSTRRLFGLFSISEEQENSILAKARHLMKFDKPMQVLEIDFSKPWFHVLFLQPQYLFLNVINQTQFRMFSSVVPILIGYLISFNKLEILLGVVVLQLALRLISHVLFRYHPIYELNMKESVLVRAYEHLIKVDPEFHSTRSSGQIISKINRGTQAVWVVAELLLFDALGLIISLTSLTIALFFVSPIVSVLLIAAFITLTLWSFIGFRLRSQIHLPRRVKAEDKATAIDIESMQQAQYIRASFSTEEQIDQMILRAHEKMVTVAMGWRFSAWIMTPQQVFFNLFTLLSMVILWKAQLSPALLLGSIIAITSFGASLYDVGRVLDKTIQSFEDANDLFTFIRDFGTQTYPVLGSDKYNQDQLKN